MENKYQRFSRLLGKLRRNRESVSQELLKTRYAAAYQKLQKELQQTATEIVKEILFSGYPYENMDQNCLFSSFQSAQRRAEDLGYMKGIGKAVFLECNEDLFFWYICLIKAEYDKEYMEYWLSHCRRVGGIFYNDLIDALYDSKGNYWYYVQDFEEEVQIRLFGYPPQEEIYLDEIRENILELKENIKAYISRT